jgi:hypothetical protein
MNQRFYQFVFCFLAVLFLATATAFTQSSVAIKGKIPFDFQVGTVTMPAGDYIVKTGYSGGAISIQTPNHAKGVWVLSNSLVKNNNGRGVAKLCFNRYGSRYFLSQVWDYDGTSGRELPKSLLERELAASTRPTTTEVAATK